MTEILYHPGTGATITADDPDGVHHYRRSGWLLLSEHQANQAQAAEREAAEREAAEREAARAAAVKEK